MSAAHTSRTVWNTATGVHWKPTYDTLVALISYLLVVSGLYLAFQVFTTARVAANFITFGPISMALLGVALPVVYLVVIRHRPLSDLGVTTEHLLPSLALSVILGWDIYQNTLAGLNLIWGREMLPLVALVIVVGLFESIFFRGWLQLRFEEAFGVIPGLLVGALLYSLYHIGYGMNGQEIVFMFFLGITFGAMFRLTRNIFLLWPFYTPVGSLYTNLSEGREIPFEATYGFVLTLVLMLGAIVFAVYLNRRNGLELNSGLLTRSAH